jgi:tyrosyl-tRNA synthetase
LNTGDADVIHRLKIFTFLSRAEIERLEDAVATEPFRREAQRTLAFEVTTLVHGAEATNAAIAAAQALFGQGELAELDQNTLRAALSELSHVTAGAGATVVQLLVDTGLCASLGEARRSVEQGGVYLNGERRSMAERFVREEDLLPGRHVLLRKGARDYALVEIAAA